MSLADIKAKISAEAQAQIRAIESDCDEQIRAIGQRVNTEVKSVQDYYAGRLAKEEPEVLRRREIVAELDAKRIDLGTRRRLVEEAFAASLHQMAELPQDLYLDFVTNLLGQAVSTGQETVLTGKNERYLTQGWLDSYNAQHNTSLTLSSERLPMSGGFVLRNGNIDTNCSWEMLLENIRSDIESEVVKKLFS